ncbi:bifunctional 4-hydroxy-2-oxoglutarate aldolase/2-dehydro-3-deoxy-phosphogluconate aldolase [Actinopolyspora mortivallis]|uniref:bifunctional 4-hydroxy-2-oxoglutarate aldolase/2-dehydro-3-deoxy-phosphogluconate aldolase n=1 Tax=Actinopolyspora mortivallis TaxID=33906 RepID=UPI00036BEC98|nr:bifunctional 4-hydroxy-2-oxoglutarate aldolase/2-dehydro-3-deoxy-phosphogluconate aldolase [Actinopolyspora mortivallis]
MRAATEILDISPVIPVVVLDEATQAVPLARALQRGGIRTVEITLRTPVALEAVERITAEVEDLSVGVGTVTEPGQAEKAARAGAEYLVTPGSTDRLLDEANETGLPTLPGVSTVSEALRVAERGFTALKFFPAEPAGGVPYLKALASPLPGLTFCPTGGITPDNAGRYLALPNVRCVGGSWLTPREALSKDDWGRVEALARQAVALG